MKENTIAPWEACADLKKKVADYPLSDEGQRNHQLAYRVGDRPDELFTT